MSKESKESKAPENSDQGAKQSASESSNKSTKESSKKPSQKSSQQGAGKAKAQRVRIATRKSPLALWQAEFVKAELIRHHPGLEVELVTMVSRGDKLLDAPLAKVGGKGLFVKELEQSMLDGRADIAVHSMKDVPVDTEFPEGLHLAVICEREDPRDAFVSNNYDSIADLPQGAKVGTCSLRRQAQIKERRPDIEILNLRGNVNSRLKKLDDGQFDAIVLAAAGLLRLEMNERIRRFMPPEESLPAIGQGAVGIECRIEDAAIHELLKPLAHAETTTRLRAERALNARLEGGCQVPIGGYAELEGDQLHMRALVGSPDGEQIIRGNISGPAAEAERLGTELANDLLSRGAKAILEEVYKNA